jgi:hypothetical protein
VGVPPLPEELDELTPNVAGTLHSFLLFKRSMVISQESATGKGGKI